VIFRRPAFLVLAVLVFLTAGTAGRAADISERLQAGTAAAVAEVVDGDTVVLDDGRQVRLVGLQAPKLPLGRKGFVKWPLADAAKRALEELILGRSVELRYGGRRTDRYRRELAHLFRDDGLWVQGDMLRRGMARVYTFPDNRFLAGEMYARERAARAEGLGIWADPFYAVRGPDGLGRDIDTFQLVEGRVFDAARVRSRVYLNYAADWKTDFTVVVSVKDLSLFEEAGLDPLALEGRRIRVRGWVREWNGPMIDATHPEQIEVLD